MIFSSNHEIFEGSLNSESDYSKPGKALFEFGLGINSKVE